MPVPRILGPLLSHGFSYYFFSFPLSQIPTCLAPYGQVGTQTLVTVDWNVSLDEIPSQTSSMSLNESARGTAHN